MAENPAFAKGPIVSIDTDGSIFTVALWTPPPGIWWRRGEQTHCASFIAAEFAANLLCVKLKASAILTYNALRAELEVGGAGWPVND